jgi:hypothetical protein
MKVFVVVLLLASPAAAQDGQGGEGRFAEGLENMLRDLFTEMEPVLRDLRDRIEDLDQYEAPEILPNGDIIIRRRTPLDEAPDTVPEPDAPEAEAPSDDPIDL